MATTLLCILRLLHAAAPCFCQTISEFAITDDLHVASLIQQRHNLQSLAGLINKEDASNLSNVSGQPQELELKDDVKDTEEHRLGFSGLASRFIATGFCRRHPCSLLLSEGDERRGVGSTAILDEAGYKEVAALKDDIEMKNFVLRIIEKYDCKVEDMGGLMGFVPWFSGTSSVQNLAKLEDGLLFEALADGEPWISYRNSAGITGENVPLNMEGYTGIASLRNDEEMKTFARRLCDDLAIKIVDDDGLEGMIKYFSGSATVQSFDTLVTELKSAAESPHSWADFA
jgi:hypothetical protein